MALDKSALLELTEALSSADGGQLMRKLLHTILQALIDAEAAEHIGVDRHERTGASFAPASKIAVTDAALGALCGLDGVEAGQCSRVRLASRVMRRIARSGSCLV